MKSKLLTAALFALSLITASAQDAANGENVALTIDFVSWANDIEGLQIRSGGRDTEITALAFRYSEPVTYRGPKVLEISANPGNSTKTDRRKEEVARRQQDIEAGLPVPEIVTKPEARESAEAGKEVPPAIAAARKRNPSLVALAILPASSKRVTVLLAPGPAGTYLARVIDDDPSRLPPGRVRVHNLSPHLIAMRVPNQPPRQLKLLENFVATPQNGTLVYELAYQENGVWEVQENNLISLQPTEQVQMVILKSDADYFTSADGSRGGFLQTVILRRSE